MRVAVIPNLDKKDAVPYTEQIIAVLRSHGASVLMNRELADTFSGVSFYEDNDELVSQCDCIIAVGGDGTIIHTAKYASVGRKPVLGVNLGRLGFLADIEKDQLYWLEKLFTGEYTVKKHMMLEVTVHSANGKRAFRALNDAVISGAQSKIFDFGLSLCGSEMHKFRADGLILATPTGSTAYSLSAGGPVIDPDMECLIFTPICPHSLFNRSTVFSADKVLKIATDSDYTGEVYLTVDGEPPIRICSEDTVSVCRSEYYTELIRIEDRSFYSIVDRKFIHNRG